MTIYRTKIELPDEMKTALQEIQGIGSLAGITDQHLLVEIDTDDEYALGQEIAELRHTLESMWQTPLTISRPVPQTKEK